MRLIRLGQWAMVVLLMAVVATKGFAVEPSSTFEIRPSGHGEGRDLVVITWRATDSVEAGEVQVPVTGLGRTGPLSIQLKTMEGVPNFNEWDTREWQWWRDCPFDTNQKRPREVSAATGGADLGPGGIRAWSRFVCDQVQTTQEWFFADLERPDEAVYDCLITVRNLTGQTLKEYGQFFASYTVLNGKSMDLGRGHFYVDEDGSLVNYQEAGSHHLDYYVTAADSIFNKIGRVPHCPRGDGKVRARWKYPISISHPNSQGYRHIVLSEWARTSSIAQGMRGIAQDYLIYPLGGDLEPDGSFVVHVRHLVANIPEDELLPFLDRAWNAFEQDHDRVHGLSRPVVP